MRLILKKNLSKEELNMADAMGKWDFYNSANEIAPVYFEIWWNELRALLWDEMSNPTIPMKQPSFYVTVQLLKNDSTSIFYDNLSTKEKETRNGLVLQSFQHIKDTLAAKRFTEVNEPDGADDKFINKDSKPHDWGTYKATKVEHLARLDAFSSLNVYNGGNRGIINATNNSNGPSWRMIVDEGAMKAFIVYPGGQSGNPGSKFYDNGVKPWSKGEYFEANFIANGEELGNKKLFKSTYKPK